MKDSIMVLSGAEGIKKAYSLTLEHKKPISVCCLSRHYRQVIGSFFDSYIKEANELGLFQKEIVTENKENREYARGKDYEVRFLDSEIESDFIIGEDMAILISFNPNDPKAVVIRDENLLSLFTLLYEQIWINSNA